MHTDPIRFDTIAQHSGQELDKATGARAVPIYQTASYGFRDTEHASDLFTMQEEGYIYSRNANPTNAVFERRMAALEGGKGAFAVSSGQAAMTIALLTIAKAGDEIVSSQELYGGTYNLFAKTFSRLGVKVKFVDGRNLDELEHAINANTKAVYAETIGNPGLQIADIRAWSETAHRHGIPLIVDSTFTTPYLLRPIEHGADIVVHSSTKFIGGHGTSIGGILIDSGKFDWGNGNFPEFTEKVPALGDRSYLDLGVEKAYTAKARFELGHDLGTTLSPFHSWLFIQGLESLAVRMEKHVSNARVVASYLAEHELVEWVNYPGLEGHPQADLAEVYLPKGAGAILSFGIKGGLEAAKHFIHSARIISHVANIGDSKSLVIHPASTTHARLTEDQQLAAGITVEQLRVSIGLEDAEDLKKDIDQALRSCERAGLIQNEQGEKEN